MRRRPTLNRAASQRRHHAAGCHPDSARSRHFGTLPL